jgi:hypothetical protein
MTTVHGELLYSLWLQRCRALFDKDPLQMSPQVLIAVARHRITTALSTIESVWKIKSKRLSSLTDRVIDALNTTHHVPVP